MQMTFIWRMSCSRGPKVVLSLATVVAVQNQQPRWVTTLLFCRFSRMKGFWKLWELKGTECKTMSPRCQDFRLQCSFTSFPSLPRSCQWTTVVYSNETTPGWLVYYLLHWFISGMSVHPKYQTQSKAAGFSTPDFLITRVVQDGS